MYFVLVIVVTFYSILNFSYLLSRAMKLGETCPLNVFLIPLIFGLKLISFFFTPCFYVLKQKKLEGGNKQGSCLQNSLLGKMKK